ncbi:MAG: YqjK-like family protein [Methylotenera sp.]
MNKKLARIAERRKRLIEDAAEQRLALKQHSTPLKSTLLLADRGLSILHYVKQRPMVAMAATALFGILKPTRLGTWFQRGWGTLLILRNVRKWLIKS